MRFVLIVITLAVLVWVAVVGDAERRANAHLADQLRIVQAGVEVTLEQVRQTEEMALSFLMDRPGLITALETVNGAQTAIQWDTTRKELDAYLNYRHGQSAERILQSHALLDQEGRVLWRASASGAPSVDMRDHSPLVARALIQARPVQGMVPNEGYVVVSPLFDGSTVVGFLKAVVPFNRLISALKTTMPMVSSLRFHMGIKPDLDFWGKEQGRGGQGKGEVFDASVLAALDRDALLRGFVSGQPFALFAEGRIGAAFFLPLPDFQGRTMGYLVGSWPTDVHQTIQWVIFPLLIGGSVLLLLFCLAVLTLKVIWKRVERDRSHLAAVTDTMAEGLCVMDSFNRIAMVNTAAETLLGYRAEEMIGASAHDLFHAHSSHQTLDASALGQCAIQQAIRERRKVHLETEFFRRRSGEIFPVEVFCSPVDEDALDRRRAKLLRSRSVSHRVLEWLMGSVFPGRSERRWSEEVAVVTFTDLSERRHSEATLNKLSQAVEQSSASVVITDSDGVIEYVNPAFTRISGYDARDVIGQKSSLLQSGQISKETYETLWATITSGRAWKGEFHNRRKDGSLYWERATIAPIRAGEGTITHFVAVKDDITDWKNVEQELFHRANYDTLTGLPNRQFLMDRLTTALAVAQREGHGVAVLFMDLDRFKQVNDSMGHAAGDVLLKQAASRMAAVLRPQDTLGRLGGDEFLVVSTGLKNETEAAKVASRLLDVVREPFTIDKREAFVSGSIGIGIGPGDFPGDDNKGPVTAQTLLRHADAAMYLAKEQGRDGYHFFTPDLERSAHRRLIIETGLRTATTDGSLRLAFQPVVETATGKVIKVEALLRWTHPQLGAVGPDEFIPLAEETGRIIDLGHWVIKASCDAVLALGVPGDGSFRLAFNVSSKQFADDVLGAITQALESRNLDPRMLEVEITERLMLDPSSDAQDQLNALRAMGVRVAIDDFGTGYSALSYLTHFHIDTLKIDRGFVSAIVGDMRGQALIGAITGMAHGLDCTVVAEGVETPEQAGLLRDLGVDALQGYLLGRPMSLEDLMDRFGVSTEWSIPLPKAHSDYDVLLGGPD
ncbi:EAL domain-containing protein [Rhodospirillum sp. A1_3_36]|uniref:sensor domain-containing protein n=1 Tax=Rhodospirillum sp. A1_3_36 TaxID=3391666 RepID=UPI0039A45CCB